MRLILLCLTLISSTAFARLENTFVGNPADGVEINGELFLRDLYNRDLYLNPYIGPEQYAWGFPRLPGENVIAFTYPRDLLERKLNDLNTACAGLGDAVLAAINLYNWSLIDEELTEMPDPADPVRLPEGGKWVPLANRLMSTIRVHRASWNRLAPEHQVALIIHEAVYGLQHPRFTGGTGKQSGMKAREVTANFFSKTYMTERRPTEIFNDLSSLDLGNDLTELSNWRKPARWRFDFFLGENLETASKILESREIGITSYTPKASLEMTFAQICDLYGNLKALQKTAHVKLESTFEARVLQPELRSYAVSEDSAKDQSYVTFTRPVTTRLTIDALTNQDCKRQLLPHFNSARDANW